MGYLICAWIILSTEIVVLLNSSIFAAVSMGIGVIAIVLITVLIYMCKYVERSGKIGKFVKTMQFHSLIVKIHTANVEFGQEALSNSD